MKMSADMHSRNDSQGFGDSNDGLQKQQYNNNLSQESRDFFSNDNTCDQTASINGAESPKYIRLRGLPWSATHKEILDFLKGVSVVNGSKGIHLITSRWDGKNTGEAYVEVESQQDVEEARKLNKASMGHRYIEVFTANSKEAKEAMRKTGSHGTSYVVKLRGLPYAINEQQIEEFFNGLEIKPEREGILFVMDRRGRATGEAFVQFESQEDTEQALGRNREKIGHRYIEIFRSSLAELKRASNGNGRPGPYDIKDRGSNRSNFNDFGGGGRNNHMRDGWNNNFNSGPNKNLGFNNLPNFTNSGNFGNSFGQNTANGSNNGGSFSGSNKAPIGNNGNFGNFGNSGNFGHGGNANAGNNQGNFGNFGSNGIGNSGGIMGKNSNNLNSGNFGSNNRFNNGNGNFGNDFGDFNNFGNQRNFAGNNFGNGNMNEFMGNRNNGSGNFGNFGNDGPGPNFNNNGPNNGNFGPVGGGRGDCDFFTIHMRGLPYSSFENDVFKFFDPIRPVNVRINFNKKGLHSGTADAFFETYDDSQLAMKRHREQMGSRYIELFFDGKSKGGNEGPNPMGIGGNMIHGNNSGTNFSRRI